MLPMEMATTSLGTSFYNEDVVDLLPPMPYPHSYPEQTEIIGSATDGQDGDGVLSVGGYGGVAADSASNQELRSNSKRDPSLKAILSGPQGERIIQLAYDRKNSKELKKFVPDPNHLIILKKRASGARTFMRIWESPEKYGYSKEVVISAFHPFGDRDVFRGNLMKLRKGASYARLAMPRTIQDTLGEEAEAYIASSLRVRPRQTEIADGGGGVEMFSQDGKLQFRKLSHVQPMEIAATEGTDVSLLPPMPFLEGAEIGSPFVIPDDFAIDPDALFHSAMSLMGSRDVDSCLIRFLFQLAAAEGHLLAAFEYAKMCREGIGGEQDFFEARRADKVALDGGLIEDFQGYFQLCVGGLGGPIDLCEAETIVFFGRSESLQRQGITQQMLSCPDNLLMRADSLVHSWPNIARFLYGLSAHRGNGMASLKYAQMCFLGTAGTKDLPSARKFYRIAFDMRVQGEYFQYFQMCVGGLGGPVSLEQAEVILITESHEVLSEAHLPFIRKAFNNQEYSYVLAKRLKSSNPNYSGFFYELSASFGNG